MITRCPVIRSTLRRDEQLSRRVESHSPTRCVLCHGLTPRAYDESRRARRPRIEPSVVVKSQPAIINFPFDRCVHLLSSLRLVVDDNRAGHVARLDPLWSSSPRSFLLLRAITSRTGVRTAHTHARTHAGVKREIYLRPGTPRADGHKFFYRRRLGPRGCP